MDLTTPISRFYDFFNFILFFSCKQKNKPCQSICHAEFSAVCEVSKEHDANSKNKIGRRPLTCQFLQRKMPGAMLAPMAIHFLVKNSQVLCAGFHGLPADSYEVLHIYKIWHDKLIGYRSIISEKFYVTALGNCHKI